METIRGRIITGYEHLNLYHVMMVQLKLYLERKGYRGVTEESILTDKVHSGVAREKLAEYKESTGPATSQVAYAIELYMFNATQTTNTKKITTERL